MSLNDDLISILLSRTVMTPDGCREWQGDKLPKGYGRVWYRGKKILVHRLVAHFFYGLDLRDRTQQALHHCDNKPCIEPTHLYVGSHDDNFRDAVNRDRICFGSRQWKVKLSEDEVRQVESDANSLGGVTTALKWGLSRGHVSNIKNHKVWRRLWA